LFDKVATATIPIIHKFNSQDLANTVNAFAEMNHHHPELFDSVATAAIRLKFNTNQLNIIESAYFKMNHSLPSRFDEVPLNVE